MEYIGSDTRAYHTLTSRDLYETRHQPDVGRSGTSRGVKPLPLGLMYTGTWWRGIPLPRIKRS